MGGFTRSIFRAASLIMAAVVSAPVTLPFVMDRLKAFGTMSNTRMLMSLIS